MAKKFYDIDAIEFEKPETKVVSDKNKANPPVASILEQSTEKEPVPVEEPAAPIKAMQLQKKQVSKKTSKQVSFDCPKGKHTFEIPNDVWADFEILLFVLQQQGKKKTLNGYITELLQGTIEENSDLIARYKKMFEVK